MEILAMDIGKTKTFAVLVDENGNILAEAVSGPSGAWLEERVILKNISEAIGGCLSKSGLGLDELDLVSISWSDLDTKEDWQKAWKIAEKIGLRKEKTIVEHDAVAAYYAVTWGEPGVAVVAGTGSIAFGMNKQGERMRSGGWGWLMGDEGSAYWIGVKALNAVSRSLDGRGGRTALTEKLKKYFSIEEELEILKKVYKELLGNPAEIARIAEIVDEAAEEEDEVSKKILSEAGEELAECILAIAKRLKMEKDDIVVGGVGSVFKSKRVNETFNRILDMKLPNARIRGPFTGEMAILGPTVIALKRHGLSITTDIVEKILGKIGARR
jgi:N-acetylglucosamine kinase-like BadF-type ATPase